MFANVFVWVCANFFATRRRRDPKETNRWVTDISLGEMQDKLGELRKFALKTNPEAASKMFEGESFVKSNQRKVALLDDPGGDLEANGRGTKGEQLVGDDSPFMAEYFTAVGRIKGGLTAIRTNVERFRLLKNQQVQASSPDQEKDISRQLNALLDQTNQQVTSVMREIEDLKEENVAFMNKHKDSSEARIRNNMHQALTRKFREVLTEYQSVQSEFKQEVVGKVTRQVRIVYPEATDEEVNRLIDAGDMSAGAAIRSRITGGHESLKSALSDIQDKHRDVRRLEASIAELHQMFVELATLVESQGDLLDQIEFSVNSAKDYTEKAEKELVTARKYQQTARKRMCWLSICLIILAIVILMPLLVVFTR